MYKWDSTDLYIERGSYNPPHAEATLTEIQLIPGPNQVEPGTILQQGQRSRYRWSMEGFTRTYAEYQDLLEDHLNMVEKTYTGWDGVSMFAVIETISPAVRVLKNKFEYSITFLEV